MIGKNLYPGIISITRLQKAGAKFDNWAPRQNIDRFTVKSAFFPILSTIEQASWIVKTNTEKNFGFFSFFEWSKRNNMNNSVRFFFYLINWKLKIPLVFLKIKKGKIDLNIQKILFGDIEENSSRAKYENLIFRPLASCTFSNKDHHQSFLCILNVHNSYCESPSSWSYGIRILQPRT